MTKTEGFTLLEALVAGAVLMLVLLGAGAMSLTAYRQLDRSGEQTTAAELGQQHMEWLRNQGYTSSDLAAGTTTETLGGTYAGYTRATAVQDNTPRADIKQVTVTMVTPSGISVEVISLIAG